MRTTMADRLRARCRQMGYNAGQAAALAGVNRSFVYDIMRAKSENPNLEKLDKLARALKVERDWLLSGMGAVEGESPIMEDLDQVFVAIPRVAVRPSMGGGAHVEEEPVEERPYHFQRAWIKHGLRADPGSLRIMRVEGDSMLPTPPGIFVLHDGMGLVAKRLEHVANSEPPRLRIISDNTLYGPYECTAEEVNIIGRIRWYARKL